MRAVFFQLSGLLIVAEPEEPKQNAPRNRPRFKGLVVGVTPCWKPRKRVAEKPDPIWNMLVQHVLNILVAQRR
jgi:hypothetical protein